MVIECSGSLLPPLAVYRAVIITLGPKPCLKFGNANFVYGSQRLPPMHLIEINDLCGRGFGVLCILVPADEGPIDSKFEVRGIPFLKGFSCVLLFQLPVVENIEMTVIVMGEFHIDDHVIPSAHHFIVANGKCRIGQRRSTGHLPVGVISATAVLEHEDRVPIVLMELAHRQLGGKNALEILRKIYRPREPEFIPMVIRILVVVYFVPFPVVLAVAPTW